MLAGYYDQLAKGVAKKKVNDVSIKKRYMEARLVLLAHKHKKEIVPSQLPREIFPKKEETVLNGSDYLGKKFKPAKQEIVDRFEKRYLLDFLEHYRGNISQSAQAAGIDRSSFQRLMSKYGLSSQEFRAQD